MRNDDSNFLVTCADQLICLRTLKGCVRKPVQKMNNICDESRALDNAYGFNL